RVSSESPASGSLPLWQSRQYSFKNGLANESKLSGTALPGTYRSDAKHGSVEIMQSDETQRRMACCN
ncbi:MAG: hypothetical protein MPJ25_12680, partial [Pirellulales bacterium]|nr:hypothetical protein [Pirellulales bacterium]